jgi:hypothetical protein
VAAVGALRGGLLPGTQFSEAALDGVSELVVERLLYVGGELVGTPLQVLPIQRAHSDERGT